MPTNPDLAALDKDAREAESIDYRMQCEAYLSRALVNEYRAGRLVHIDPENKAFRERVAQGIFESRVFGTVVAWVPGGNSWKQVDARDLADAAIAAMGGAK